MVEITPKLCGAELEKDVLDQGDMLIPTVVGKNTQSEGGIHLLPGACSVKNTILIPAFNEEMGLPVVLEKILMLVDNSYEIIVVDDGSTDGTKQVASRYPVRVVSHRFNQGKGVAMMTGINHARGENVIFIDADDTYPAETILEIVSALEHCDMAVASRVRGHQNIPAFNRIGNAIFRNSIRYIYGFRAYDPLTGLYGIKKRHIEKMHLVSRGFGIESEIAIKAGAMGLAVKDIPIVYRERIGEAKLNGLRDGYRIACTIASYLPRYNPTLTFVLPGLLLLLAGLAVNGVYLARCLAAVAAGTAPLHFPLDVLLSMLAVPVGLTLIVFGVSTHLYSVRYRNARESWLIRGLLRIGTVRTTIWGGLVVAGLSLVGLALMAEVGFRRGYFLSLSSFILVGLLAMFSGPYLGGGPHQSLPRKRIVRERKMEEAQ